MQLAIAVNSTWLSSSWDVQDIRDAMNLRKLMHGVIVAESELAANIWTSGVDTAIVCNGEGVAASAWNFNDLVSCQCVHLSRFRCYLPLSSNAKLTTLWLPTSKQQRLLWIQEEWVLSACRDLINLDRLIPRISRDIRFRSLKLDHSGLVYWWDGRVSLEFKPELALWIISPCEDWAFASVLKHERFDSNAEGMVSTARNVCNLHSR